MRDHINKWPFSLLVLFLALVFGCTTKKSPKNYINNDASAIYSTNKVRPFKYGFTFNRTVCEKYFRERVNDFGIQNGDVIADVGAASGWLDGIYSVLVDSVTFYVQDIDTHYLDQTQLNNVVEFYSKQRLTPQTNQFHMVLGTEESTRLPEGTFDKIIIYNTLHEIENPDAIVADLSTKLKQGGKILIFDEFSSFYKKIIHPGCMIVGSEVKDVVSTFNEQGFYLTRMKEPENSVLNCLTFEKDQEAGEEYTQQRNKVSEYIAQLDLLNQKKISADSNLVLGIANQLKEHLEEIHMVYPTLMNYLGELADEWLEEGAKKNAIHTLKVALILYPENPKGFYLMGEALSESKRYEEALNHYSKAIQLDGTNMDYFDARGSALVNLKRYDEAIEDYYTAISSDSTDPDYYYNLGYAFDAMGDYGPAVDYYSIAIRLDPTDHSNIMDRAYAYLTLERIDEALADFDKAIELDPENWIYYINRAAVKKKNGDLDGAKLDRQLANKLKSKKK